MRAIAYLLGSLIALAAMIVGDVRKRHARNLGPFMGLAVVTFVLAVWGLYGNGHSAAWVNSAMFGAVYSLVCLAAGGIAMVVVWRRQVAHEEQLALAKLERDRQVRLERIRAETAAQTPDDALEAGGDFALPARPKWDDTF